MPDSLGARLREARVQRGLSLRAVAQSLGVSASLISQVEIGKTRPSVSTLWALANHLGVSLDELLGMEKPAVAAAPDLLATAHRAPVPVQRREDNPVIEMQNGVRWERLAGGSGPADAVLVSYEPGASSSVENKLMRHVGIEYAYVFEGELTLQLEFDTFTLRPGDSLQFDSVRPHLFSNRGDVVARGLWFVVGRREPGVPANLDGSFDEVPSGPPASAVDVLRQIDELSS